MMEKQEDRASGRAPHERKPLAGSAVPVGIPDVVVLVRADDPEKKPLLYACPKCGSVHSPEIYLAAEEVRHATAMRAAEDCYRCKTHYNCGTCGVETPKGWTRCRGCRVEDLLNKATEIADDGGPYCEFDGDRYYFDLQEARDDNVEWVSPCNTVYPRLDADSILESATEEMFEDASIDDLNGVVAFSAAVKAFNEAQSTPTFYGDSKRKINVAKAIEAREGGDGEAGSVHESASA